MIFREKTVAIENRVSEAILIANQSYNKLRYWDLKGEIYSDAKFIAKEQSHLLIQKYPKAGQTSCVPQNNQHMISVHYQ